MAVRAVFSADFSSFQTAVKSAEAKLVDLSKGADRVGKDLDRMVVSFSGRKVVQEALLIEKAIEQIGGISKLTAKELEQVSAKASEAVAKLKAMGQTVPPGLQNIANAAKATTTEMTSMLGTVGKVAGVLGIAFSAGAVISGLKNLITGTIEAGSRIKELHLQSGLSTDTLQALGAAGRTVGVSMQSIAQTAQQLSQRIAGGDDSASKAVLELGLNLTKISQLDVESQLIEVANALGKVTDQGKQAALANDLFGKSGIQLVKILRDNGGSIEELTSKMKAQNLVMEQDTIEALDKASAAWERLGTKITVVTGNFLSLFQATGNAPTLPGLQPPPSIQEQLQRLGTGLQLPQAGITITGPIPGGPEPIFGPNEPTAQEQRSRARAIQEQADATRKLKDAEEQRKRELEQLNQESVKAAQHLQKFITAEYESTEAIQRMNIVTREQMANLRDGLTAEGLIPATRALERMGKVIDGTKAFGASAPSYWEPAAQGAKKVKTTADQLHTAFGNVSTILNNIPGQFADIANVATRTAEAILSSWGNWIQVAVAGVTGLIQIVSRIGGPNEQQREARQNQAAFIKQLEATATAQQKVDIAAVKGSRDYATLAIVGRDAMLAIGKSAAEAERVVKGLLDTENPKNFARAMEEVQNALDLQNEAMETLEDTLSRYKFSIEELGPALQSQQLSKQAQQLFKDWQVLTGAGVNLAAVGREMAESVNDFVRNAIKFRTEVDPAMRPMIQSMIDMGLLFDENGDQIKDLESSGITFAKTISQQFDRLIDKMDDLVKAIRIALGLYDELEKKSGGTGGTGGGSGGNKSGAGGGGGTGTGGGIQFDKLNGAAMDRAAASGRSNGSNTIHTHLYLDGRQIAEQVTRVQTDDFLLRNKTRAA